jgi:protein-tyrosine phosphatase
VLAAGENPCVTDAIFGRDLGLAGLPNARDLGGYTTANGREIRYGRLLRADAPIRATEEDLVILNALGATRMIDMRGDIEVERFGLGEWDIPRVHLPVGGDVMSIIMERLAGPDAGSMTAEISEQMMVDMYRDFVAEDASRGQFAAALKLIAAPDGLPLLFHCTAGKDRTGWLAALVLTALGVDRDTVIADYLLTNERFTTGRGAAGRDRLLAAMGGLVSDVSVLMPLFDARSDYLEAAFDEAETRYGTFEAFLRDGLDADVDRLRTNLLD